MRPNDDTDLERKLVDRARSGERDAFAALVHLYCATVFGFLKQNLRQVADAEDLTQITFLKALKGLSTFDPDQGPLGPWLITIARRSLVDYCRKSQRAPLTATDSVVYPPSPEPTAEQHAWASERSAAIKACLAKLRAPERDLIDQMYFQNMALNAIAAELKISPKTAESRVFRVRQKLRLCLSQRLGLSASDASPGTADATDPQASAPEAPHGN